MTDELMTYYPWIKAVHVIAVISWMAGMLYLPRLYVYHVMAGQQSSMAVTFEIMEKRLLRYIMNPAMIIVFVAGIALIVANPELMHQGWLHAKITAVVAMVVVHGMLAKYRKQLAAGVCTKKAKFFKVLNEVPTVLMIAIVILVIVKPF